MLVGGLTGTAKDSDFLHIFIFISFTKNFISFTKKVPGRHLGHFIATGHLEGHLQVLLLGFTGRTGTLEDILFHFAHLSQ